MIDSAESFYPKVIIFDYFKRVLWREIFQFIMASLRFCILWIFILKISYFFYHALLTYYFRWASVRPWARSEFTWFDSLHGQNEVGIQSLVPRLDFGKTPCLVSPGISVPNPTAMISSHWTYIYA